MKKVILLAIFLITVGTKAQENSIELTKNKEVLKCFPASWEGNYEGELQIYGVEGEKIPEVVTNFVNGRQKAILKKIK